MKDRVSTYPGRVTLTPVPGQENTFDLRRADQPTDAGTPINKASLLQDATAARLGLTQENPTVNDALNAIADSRAKIAAGSYVGTGAWGQASPTVIDFPFPPKLVFFSGPVLTQYIWGDTGFYTSDFDPADLRMYRQTVTVSGNRMSFYSNGGNAYQQLNQSGTVYNWVIIG